MKPPAELLKIHLTEVKIEKKLAACTVDIVLK